MDTQKIYQELYRQVSDAGALSTSLFLIAVALWLIVAKLYDDRKGHKKRKDYS